MGKFNSNFLLEFISSYLLIVLVQGQYQGSSCIVERTGTNGVCKPIDQCPTVVDDIRNRRGYTRCGFEGRVLIACCPFSRPIEPSTEPPSITSNSRISERKCSEYKSAVYEYTFSLSLEVDAERQRIRVDKCGHKAIPLIVGGEFAKPKEFPHMALLGFDTENGAVAWRCGGALISKRFVLTAGHCVTDRTGAPKYVRLGELNILSNNDDARPEDFDISLIITHPRYRRSSKYNDIALIKLDRDVQFDPYKRAACLPTQYDGPEQRTIATGWGDTAWSGSSSSHLQKVILDKFTQEECNLTYATEIDRRLNKGIQYETQLCAGSRSESKDTCQGDSGGPLQVYHQYEYCMYTIIGVTSFGITCGNIGIPGVYTRVYSYLDWIESVVWAENN